ncbi:hypothetical protein CCB80_01820 [Armatimonadetes bacterium Uphvl-Ar1]|nr:hypothetical protein CCB80_01820 [Armatimonadetes bacterium Uphvl-Ar1]
MSHFFVTIFSLAIGTVAGTVSFLGLWGVVYLFTAKNEPKLQRKIPASVLITSLVLKLPTLGIGYYAVRSMGSPGPTVFALGIVLVYSAAVATLVFDRSGQDH